MHARRIQYLVKSIQIYKKYSVLQSHTIHHLSQTRHTSRHGAIDVYAPHPTRGTGWWPTPTPPVRANPLPDDPIQSGIHDSSFTPPHPHKKPHHDASPHGGVWRGPCGVPTPSTGHDSKRVPPLSRPRLLSTIGGVRGVWMMDDPDAIANAVDAARDASSSSSHLGASFPLSRERITRTRCTPPPRR